MKILHELIRDLEKKKWNANRAFANQTRRAKSGLPIKVLPTIHAEKIKNLDSQIHKLKLQR